MTRPLPITKPQAKTLTEAANASGCVIEVEKDGFVWRVIPAKHRDREAGSRDKGEEITL